MKVSCADPEEILEYPLELLPADVQFKGYEQVIVQDIKLSTDNVLFRKQKYYSPSEGKLYLAQLPLGYEGEFGPGVKALVISLYYGGNMTQGKLLEFLEDVGISMSAGHLSNMLIKNHSDFESEKTEIYCSGLASSPWHHFDQTGSRVGGVNYTTNIVGNPLYTVYFATPKKDRLTVVKGLQNGEELQLILNPLTYDLLETFQVGAKVLEHPQLPLHNNPAELAARTIVQQRNISYATQTTDTFMSLVATTRKLGLSFFEYLHHHICKTPIIPNDGNYYSREVFCSSLGLVLATRIIAYPEVLRGYVKSYEYTSELN